MRRGELRRKTPLRRAPLKSRPKPTGPAPDVVEAVYERAHWSCERCRTAVGSKRGTDHHIHHRRPRAMGGTDRPDTNLPPNLLLLCPGCHTEVESRRGEAQHFGWLVPQVGEPADVAVLIGFDRWRYLTPAGRYSTTPPKKGATDA